MLPYTLPAEEAAMSCTRLLPFAFGLLLSPAALPALGQQSFVNWETPHVSPLALSADCSGLLLASLLLRGDAPPLLLLRGRE